MQYEAQGSRGDFLQGAGCNRHGSTVERREESQCPARKGCFPSLEHDILSRATHFEKALGCAAYTRWGFLEGLYASGLAKVLAKYIIAAT